MISIVVLSPPKIVVRFHSFCGDLFFFPLFALGFGEWEKCCLLLGFSYEKRGVEKLRKGKLQKIEVRATPTM